VTVAPALLSRAVLEDYLLWVGQQSGWKPATRNHRVVALRALLEEQAEDGLAGLPRSAAIHRAELPRVDYRLPEQLPGEVFAQWVDPANLALLDDEQNRTVALLLAFTGFRISSVVTRDARRARARVRRPAVSALLQHQGQAPGDAGSRLDRDDRALRAAVR
jgi:integrase